MNEVPEPYSVCPANMHVHSQTLQEVTDQDGAELYVCVCVCGCEADRKQRISIFTIFSILHIVVMKSAIPLKIKNVHLQNNTDKDLPMR